MDGVQTVTETARWISDGGPMCLCSSVRLPINPHAVYGNGAGQLAVRIDTDCTNPFRFCGFIFDFRIRPKDDEKLKNNIKLSTLVSMNYIPYELR